MASTLGGVLRGSRDTHCMAHRLCFDPSTARMIFIQAPCVESKIDCLDPHRTILYSALGLRHAVIDGLQPGEQPATESTRTAETLYSGHFALSSALDDNSEFTSLAGK